MDNLPKQFGKKVREIRLARKLSQGDVSRRLGLHRSYISGIERGVRNPSLKVVEKIARALGVKANDLLN
jgi:transcriptional regulator with XRE-family HTH domain